MKLPSYTIKNKIESLEIICIIGLTLIFCGCESIYDKDMNCDPIYKVKFSYTMNMSGGDGFPAQVSSVSLWVFNHSDGSIAATYADAGKHLAEPGYTLELTGLRPGNYDIVTWGGLASSTDFFVPSNITNIKDLTCTLQTSDVYLGMAASNKRLSPLFYGSLTTGQLPTDPGEHVYSLPLMKDTNNINISLQHKSDEVLDHNDFTVYMTYANGSMAWDNALIPSHDIVYRPWFTDSGAINLTSEELNYFQAEISTPRLMADGNPFITIIDNDSQKVIYSIPFVEWVKKLRSIEDLSMDDQEYLDREHEYTLMLYLVKSDQSSGWRTVSIKINGYDID